MFVLSLSVSQALIRVSHAVDTMLPLSTMVPCEKKKGLQPN